MKTWDRSSVTNTGGGKKKKKKGWKERTYQILLRRSEGWWRGRKYLQNVTFVKADEWSGKWGEVKIGLVKARPLHVHILDCVEERIHADWSQRRSTHTHTTHTHTYTHIHTHTHTYTHTYTLQCQHSFVYSSFCHDNLAHSLFSLFPFHYSQSKSIRTPHRFRTHLFTQPIINHEKVWSV